MNPQNLRTSETGPQSVFVDAVETAMRDLVPPKKRNTTTKRFTALAADQGEIFFFFGQVSIFDRVGGNTASKQKRPCALIRNAPGVLDPGAWHLATRWSGAEDN